MTDGSPDDTRSPLPPLPWHDPRQRRRRPAATPHLDLDRILEAGLRIVDGEGAAALSIRRLAADLGVTPMALYWHVTDKAALLDLIGERVLAEVVMPPAVGTWRDQLGAIHRAMLGPMLEHPNAVDLMIGRARYGPAGIALFERILEVLLEAGLDPPAAFDAYQSLYLFQLGFMASARRSPAFREIQRQGVGYLRSLDPERFPAISAVAPAIGARTLVEQYEIGLDVVIQGVAARLGPRG
jgi:TetR/AcrR family tetracycline transcriptional repressor